MPPTRCCGAQVEASTTPLPTDGIVAAAAPSDTAAVVSASAVATASAAPSASERVAGIIGLFGAADRDPNAPTAPWGRDDSLGVDAGARGNMWGETIGDSFGAGGRGLRGTGAGDGGARGEGIGLGNLGTMGHGTGSHVRSPRLRQGATTVNGRLPPEVIQRIVRQNFGRFRLCYEDGLRKDPKLAGTVATKFVIDDKGTVTSTARDDDAHRRVRGLVHHPNLFESNVSFAGERHRHRRVPGHPRAARRPVNLLRSAACDAEVFLDCGDARVELAIPFALVEPHAQLGDLHAERTDVLRIVTDGLRVVLDVFRILSHGLFEVGDSRGQTFLHRGHLSLELLACAAHRIGESSNLRLDALDDDTNTAHLATQLVADGVQLVANGVDVFLRGEIRSALTGHRFS